MKFAQFTVLVLIVLLSAAQADIIHLKNGGQIEGEIIGKSEGLLIIRLVTGGQVRIEEEEIASIENKELSLPPSELYMRRKKSLGEGDANGHYELALYCIKHRLYREARKELESALKLDSSFRDKVNDRIEELKRAEKSWLYNQGILCSRSGQYKQALAYLSRLLKDYPGEDIAADAKRLEQKIRKKLMVEKLLREVELAKNEEEIRKIILLMGIKQDAATLDVLLRLIKSRNLQVKVTVIEALSLWKDKRPIASLRLELTNRNALVREKAVRALGQLRDEGAGQLIVPLLEDKSSGVRAAAAIALGEIENEASVISLTKALNDESADVRVNVIRVLGKIGDKKATRALIFRLEEEDLEMRLHIYRALGNISDPKAAQPLLGAMKGESVKGQEYIIVALAKIKTQDAVGGLLELLSSLKRETLLEKVLAALAGIDDERIIPAIGRVLKHPSPRVREKAISTLGMTKDSRALYYLEQALADPAASVRMEAAREIQKFEPKK